MNQTTTKRVLMSALCALTLLSSTACASTEKAAATDWKVLFDGSSLDGWKASETPGVFSIVDGDTLQVAGGRSHLFWMGTESIPATFTNFEVSARVKTTYFANSGFFFHTEYQETGWPTHGYEVQINTTHKDKRKTGSIYGVKDIEDVAPSTDDQWFDLVIRVEGKAVTVHLDGQLINTYVEPDDLAPEERFKDRRFSKGTFAIQGHDPKCVVYYQDIKVRILD